ncbi:MAG TPA: hypothetical protein VFF06_08910 [Polyangia bacterium]|nr:hypothetical protein [Polyangia bacterium]
MRFVIVAALLGGWLAPARAQSGNPVVSKRAAFAGSNELSAQLGFQASLGGTTPGGVKLFFDYSRKLTDVVWFNVKLNPAFSTSSRALCLANGVVYDCGAGFDGNGDSIDFLAGIKLKFPIARYRLLPYANFSAGVVAILGRPSNDDGAAVVFRPGGGVKYFVTPHIGLGAELDFTFGAGFYSATCNGCRDAHDEFYRAIDFAVGAEFLL